MLSLKILQKTRESAGSNIDKYLKDVFIHLLKGTQLKT